MAILTYISRKQAKMAKKQIWKSPRQRRKDALAELRADARKSMEPIDYLDTIRP